MFHFVSPIKGSSFISVACKLWGSQPNSQTKFFNAAVNHYCDSHLKAEKQTNLSLKPSETLTCFLKGLGHE